MKIPRRVGADHAKYRRMARADIAMSAPQELNAIAWKSQPAMRPNAPLQGSPAISGGRFKLRKYWSLIGSD
jgi:hypothetical protein